MSFQTQIERRTVQKHMFRDQNAEWMSWDWLSAMQEVCSASKLKFITSRMGVNWEHQISALITEFKLMTTCKTIC